jgi:diacylglycerol kinase (ATP)
LKKKIRFIYNPFSGTRHPKSLTKLVEERLEHAQYDAEICPTQYSGHARELSREAAEKQYYAVVAAGGDGTINEVASGLLHSETILGVLPFGSGNGFAYHIGIRRNIHKAFEVINDGVSIRIDVGKANENVFVNVAGLGLDATVAFKTRLNHKRGFFPYFLQTIKESIGFTYMNLYINTTEKSLNGSYAMAVVANGSVYGYDFTVAPAASMDDGLFDVLLVKKAPVFRYAELVVRMLTKSFHKSPLVIFFRTSSITIKSESPTHFHVDGEGFTEEREVMFNILPKALKVFQFNQTK